ncbi:MAG: Thrombospondin type 3 repeat [Proteobacteria bacterium]|nr:Thrombospondin type 3 repeat [Pseudomonadota bacterium]
MKKIAVLLIAISALVSGCMVYDTPYHDRGQRQGNRDRDHDGVPDRMERDRDGDGVPNRQDRRPDDPHRN